MNQEPIIYRNGCWGCKRSHEDPAEEYICPRNEEHLREYEKYERQ